MQKHISTTTGLLIILAAAVIIGGGALTYFYIKSPTAFDLTVQSPIKIAKKTAKKTTPPAVTDPIAGWKTYTDTNYELLFKYPKDWADPTKEDISGTDNPIGLVSRYLSFEKNTNGVYKSASLSHYSDYAGTNYADDLEKIKTAFSNQSAAGTEKLMLPAEEAATMAASTPEYLETSDKKFRGIYYFANIGQAYSTDIACVIIMTDGADKVVQYTMAANSDNAANYNVDQNSNAAFIAYVNGLDATTSTETVVKDFKSTYKLMAQSLKAL